MGIWNRITGQAKAQFLDVIQWLDDSTDTVVHRFPIYDQAITDQSKLIVREGQSAVFISEGQMSDVFAPGTYTLNTANQPIWAFFQTLGYGLDNPFKGDVLFVNTRQFTNNGWGTQNPFMMRDAEFGPVRVRAFGTYSFRVVDPATFVRQIVGTDGRFTTDEITGQLKKRVAAAFATSIGQARIPVLDLAAHYMDLGDRIREQMDGEFRENYGLALTDFTVGNISLPKAVEEALDSRSKMGILGDLNAYTQLKSADAIEKAAENPGLGGAGVGMGVGFGMGGHMASQMARGAGSGTFDPHQGAAPPPLPQAATFHYAGPTGQAQLDAAAIGQRVVADRTGQHLVWKAGWDGWKAWSDVPEIAAQVPPDAPPPPPLPSAAPPPPPTAPAPAAEPSFEYHGPDGASTRTLSEVVAAVQAAPDADHQVWQAGWDGWKAAADVPEIAAQLEG